MIYFPQSDPRSLKLSLVLELMEEDLLMRMKRSFTALSLRKSVKGFMHQLLKALDHMHRHGIFHRDIKP